MAVPKYDEMFNPLLQALHELGGSGTNTEIDEKVAEILRLSDEDVNRLHRGNRTQLSYRLAWSRNYLKRYGLLENSDRGVWSLTPKGLETKKVDKDEVNRVVKGMAKTGEAAPDTEDSVAAEESSPVWEDELLKAVMSLSPASFERLAQRILRESGFVEVTVTGGSGDGGIDGFGTYRMAGLLSFKVIFQCKRYTGSVSSNQMREFKGTMAGRAEKGLFITTGTFTREARKEAQRAGSAPIDLVDGEQLVEIMKNLGLGVTVHKEEVVELNQDWFDRFD